MSVTFDVRSLFGQLKQNKHNAKKYEGDATVCVRNVLGVYNAHCKLSMSIETSQQQYQTVEFKGALVHPKAYRSVFSMQYIDDKGADCELSCNHETRGARFHNIFSLTKTFSMPSSSSLIFIDSSGNWNTPRPDRQFSFSLRLPDLKFESVARPPSTRALQLFPKISSEPETSVVRVQSSDKKMFYPYYDVIKDKSPVLKKHFNGYLFLNLNVIYWVVV